MSALNDRQNAVAKAIAKLHKVIEDEVGSDEEVLSIPGIGIELYLVGFAMKDEYQLAAFKIADHYAMLVDSEPDEYRKHAYNLIVDAQEEIASQN